MPLIQFNSGIEKIQNQPRPIIRTVETSPSVEMRKWLFEQNNLRKNKKIVF